MFGRWTTTPTSRWAIRTTPTPYAPPLAQFAFREARVLADDIAAHLDGRADDRVEYRSLGTMAALGGRTRVADPGRRITGFLAWAA